jgi:hypothetical protein
LPINPELILIFNLYFLSSIGVFTLVNGKITGSPGHPASAELRAEGMTAKQMVSARMRFFIKPHGPFSRKPSHTPRSTGISHSRYS